MNSLNESLFEFALLVQQLIDLGWRLEKIHYGDSGGSSYLTVTRNGVTEYLYDADHLRIFVEKESK